MAEKKPEKAEKKPSKKVEYAAGIYPKRPLKDNEVNVRGMTFDKSALQMPEWVKQLPVDQQKSLLSTPYDSTARATQGPWQNEQQRQQALKWILGQQELELWKKEHPSAYESFSKAFPYLISGPLVWAGLAARDTGLLDNIMGGSGEADQELKSLTRFKERDIYTPEQKAALNELIPQLTKSLHQMHEEGRQPIPTWQQIPWEAIAQGLSAGTDYYANSSALADQYRNGELPQLTGALESLGAPVNSSAYQNALEKSGQSYNDRLWALRAGAASKALGALGSLGQHGRNLEETRQRRFQQLSNLGNITGQYAFAPQQQVLQEQLLPPPPTWQQQLGELAGKIAPAAIQTVGKFAGIG